RAVNLQIRKPLSPDLSRLLSKRTVLLSERGRSGLGKEREPASQVVVKGGRRPPAGGKVGDGAIVACAAACQVAARSAGSPTSSFFRSARDEGENRSKPRARSPPLGDRWASALRAAIE